MYVRFDATIERNQAYNMDEDFRSELALLDEYPEDCFPGTLKISVSDYDGFDEDPPEESFKKAGYLYFHAYNISTLLDVDFEKDPYATCLFDCMDANSIDHVKYFETFLKALENHDIADKEYFNELVFFSSEKYLVTIDKFVIANEFRRKGIVSYLLSNIKDILKAYFNIDIITAVGILNPNKGEPENMREIQEKCYTKNGFTVYSSDKYFYKNLQY